MSYGIGYTGSKSKIAKGILEQSFRGLRNYIEFEVIKNVLFRANKR